MPNAITADSSAQARIERCFAEICRAIPDGGSIGIYAQTDPIPVDEALAEDERRVAIAAAQDRHAGQHGLAEARGRLLTAQRQSVVNAAGSEQPAVAARWWVAVPYRAHEDELTTRFRHAIVPGARRVSWRSHQRAAADSRRQTELTQTQLSQAGIEPLALDGVQVLAALWERFHPGARELPDMAALADATTIATATSAEQAGAHRHRILQRIAHGPCEAAISASDPRWLRARRRHLGGGAASRDTAAAHIVVVADAPARVPAAGHGGGAYSGREPRADPRAATSTVAAAVGVDRLQAPSRASRRRRGARGARRGRAARLRARRRDRRDRLQGLCQRRDPRPARPRRRVRNARQGDRPRVPGAHRRSGHPRAVALAPRLHDARSRSASTPCVRPGPTRSATSRTASR